MYVSIPIQVIFVIQYRLVSLLNLPLSPSLRILPLYTVRFPAQPHHRSLLVPNYPLTKPCRVTDWQRQRLLNCSYRTGKAHPQMVQIRSYSSVASLCHCRQANGSMFMIQCYDSLSWLFSRILFYPNEPSLCSPHRPF